MRLMDRLFAPHGVDRYVDALRPSWTLGTAAMPASTSTAVLDAPVETLVRFTASGVDALPEGTLLETAEAAGLTPKNRCRRGICGTCTSTKTSGQVRNLLTGELSSSDAEPIRICVSVACGDVAVEL